MIHNKLKARLKEGKSALGTFISLNSPELVEICGLCGFDFVIIDGEHGPTGPENAINMIRAAECRGITPITRIPNRLESTILHFLDIGAHGIQLPQINHPDAAWEVVQRSKYKPLGHRGVAFPRAADFGITDLAGYFDHENKETLIVTHCENKECLDNLEAICQVPEVDVIFMGPYDMSQSMGVTGQVTHPLVEAATQKVLEVTKAYGKIAGIYVGSPEMAKLREEQGFQYIALGMDTVLFAAKCKEMVEGFKK